jgi:hypothetical protein
MTRTTQTLERPAPTAGTDLEPSSRITRRRLSWITLLAAAAVVALTAWTLVTLRDSGGTVEPSVSIRQIERAEMERQGVTSYGDLRAVRQSRQRYAEDSAPGQQVGPAAVSSPSQRQHEPWQMELNELRRFRGAVPPGARGTVEAEIRHLEELVGAAAKDLP